MTETKIRMLKPCPCCGGKAEIMGGYYGPFAYCTKCHAHRSRPLNDGIPDAIKQWNDWNGKDNYTDL